MLGGLGALGQRRWGALVGHVTLADWGASLIALGLGTRAGAEQMAASRDAMAALGVGGESPSDRAARVVLDVMARHPIS